MSTESRQITRLDNDDGSHIMQLDKCNIRDDGKWRKNTWQKYFN